MEQGGFGGRYETMSSGESCQTSGPRLAHVRFRLSPGIGYAVIMSASLNSGHGLGRSI